MESEPTSPSIVSIKSCNCSCGCNFRAGAAAASPSSSPWLRCTKRKLEQILSDYQNQPADTPNAPLLSIARVEIENECTALREALGSQHQTIQELYTELEEERNAAASAANEAMSMILRLQREKAEVQMESRQYKRYTEEKMAHDQQELQELEELLYKREQLIQALNCEILAYKHRLLSLGCGDHGAAGIEAAEGINSGRTSNLEKNSELGGECILYDYPPLKCNVNEVPDFSDATESQVDLEKYALGDTPLARQHLQNLEFRIGQLEKKPESSYMEGDFATTRTFLEKATMNKPAGMSKHYRNTSQDSDGSFKAVIKEVSIGKESPVGSGIKVDDSLKNEGNSFPIGTEFGDDGDDRVYTIDSVHGHLSSSNDPSARAEGGEADIKKLYMRLEALEADRESMRQAIISMSTDKAQLVLLKEVAQQFCTDMSLKKPMPIKKPSVVRSFSLVAIVKVATRVGMHTVKDMIYLSEISMRKSIDLVFFFWVFSFVFWRKKARRSKYIYDLLNNNLGLLLLLENSPPRKQWRCLSRLPRI